MVAKCNLAYAVLIATTLFAMPAFAESISGRVVAVADGDTLTLLDRSFVEHKIRISGIDAPEKKQAFGQRAKTTLSASAYGLPAEADCRKTDRYGRNICVVRVNGRDVGLEQIRAGMAWWYRQYARDQSWQEQRDYEDAEGQAKSAKRGLWTDKEPIPPWEWRRASKKP